MCKHGNHMALEVHSFVPFPKKRGVGVGRGLGWGETVSKGSEGGEAFVDNNAQSK